MRGDLATKWWTPVSLRGVVSFAWISLLITAFMLGISWMRGDDHGTTLSLMALIANTVIVWILPEDVPARPVPEKFGLFLVCGASMAILSVIYLSHRSSTTIGLTLVDYWMASPSMIVGAAAVVAAVKSSRWFMGRATTSEALEGLARSKRHTGRITQAAKQIVLLHLGIFAVLPPSGRSCSHSPPGTRSAWTSQSHPLHSSTTGRCGSLSVSGAGYGTQ